MTKVLRYRNKYAVSYNNIGLKKKILLSKYVVSKKPIIQVTSVTLDIRTLDLSVGETKQLNATVLPVDATDKSVTWSTSDKTKAIVTQSGLVTAVSKGDVVIKATAGNISDTCSVTIQENIPVFEDGDLLASNTSLLMASPTDKLKYTTEYPATLIEDNLSNKNINTNPFSISFTFVPDKNASHQKLFELPGLCSFSSDWSSGNGLIVYLEGYGYSAVSNTYLSSDKISVMLYRKEVAEDVFLQINEYTFTVFNTLKDWVQPLLTSNDSYGTLSCSSNTSSTTEQAAWHALDGQLPNADIQSTYFGWNGWYLKDAPAWWKWELPTKLLISSISLYNRATTGTVNYSKTMHIFADENDNVQIGDEFIMPNNSTDLITVPNIQQTLTDCIKINVYDTYQTDTNSYNYGGIGELYITAKEKIQSGSYNVKNLQIYNKNLFNSLLLKDTFGE